MIETNAKEKANEILRKFAKVKISVAFDEYEIIDTNLGEEDNKTVLSCALLLVEEMIDLKVFPSFWREVKEELLKSNGFYNISI